jgi:predicted HNH restriction endonuclease
VKKLEITDESGTAFNQNASYEASGSTLAVTFESRGGRGRNDDYAKALDRILSIFAEASAQLDAASVESTKAVKDAPDLDGRNIQTTQTKPISLSDHNLYDLRIQLTNQREPGGADGTPNLIRAGAWKRATFTFSFPTVEAAIDAIRVATTTSSTDADDMVTDDESANALPEGARRVVTVNVYERRKSNRRDCIKHHGDTCAACNMSFKDVYGDFADGFIHVHHVVPVSQLGAGYTIDPKTDLVPVCPNCHAMLHRGCGDTPRTVPELQAHLRRQS